MKLLWQMKCAVVRSYAHKLRFIGKSKIRFPVPPSPPRPPLRPGNGSSRRCIVGSYRPRGASDYTNPETAARMQLRRPIRADSRNRFRRGFQNYFGFRSHTLLSTADHVSK